MTTPHPHPDKGGEAESGTITEAIRRPDRNVTGEYVQVGESGVQPVKDNCLIS